MKNQINIYIDGPTEDEMQKLSDKGIEGYTFNPTLFRNLGVKNYLEHSKRVLGLSNNLPVSLEVIGDSHADLVDQAEKLSLLASNVYVKIPITFTNGESTVDTIKYLAESDIKLNITAIFTIEQIKHILPVLEKSETILSIFAGRIYDIGINAGPFVKEISDYIHNNSNCNVLWASPRMVYDYVTAEQSGCDIITMSPQLYKKMQLFGKSPEDYSLDTVKMFYEDAQQSGFVI